MVNAEPAFVLVFLATVAVVACLPGRSMEAARRRLDSIAERRSLAILLVALLSLLANGVFAWRHGIPVPSVSDEFAHLLGADTFCEGRLTNPPHPMWRHFETEGVIHEPTYQSKYPPAHSMTLAGGRLLTGHAIAGVWITLALASGALCWMLQAWVGARWALVGSTLAAISPTVVEGWGAVRLDHRTVCVKYRQRGDAEPYYKSSPLRSVPTRGSGKRPSRRVNPAYRRRHGDNHPRPWPVAGSCP